MLLPLNPLPRHLAPVITSHSLATSEEKRALFTSVYLNAASTGQSDTLDWLLSIPDAPRAASILAKSRSGFGTQRSEELEELSDSTPKKWVDLEALDADGRPALVTAVSLGNTDCVGILIEAGVEIDAQDKC